MVDRTMPALLRSLKNRVTALERRLARVSRNPTAGQLADPGDVKATAAATAPAGWLIMAGQSLLRADYPDLFAAIGTTYGSVDATHFTLPDARGRVLVGRDASQVEFDVLGEKAGAKTHTLTIPEMPSHTHTLDLNTAGYSGGVAYGNVNFGQGYASHPQYGNGTDQPSGPRGWTGGSGAHNNLQPYIVLNYIIKT